MAPFHWLDEILRLPIPTHCRPGFTFEGGNAIRSVRLTNALHVPDLRSNLISVAKITDAGNYVIFTKRNAKIKDGDGKTILIADRMGDLYCLREPGHESTHTASAGTQKPSMTICMRDLPGPLFPVLPTM